MTICVGSGRVAPMLLNMLAKIGTTNLSRAPTTRVAMLITETG